MHETDKFLTGLENEGTDPLEAPLSPAEGDEGKAQEGEGEELVPSELKNRRHKRLEDKNQMLREENIQLNERLKIVSEAKKFSTDNGDTSEHLKAVERIFGTDSPEAVAATELLKTALTGVQKRATEDALETFRKEQREAADALKNEEVALGAMLEDLEEEHNIDLTSASSAEVRKGFFKMLERLSPKDASGNILQYADHHAVWDEFQSKLKKKNDSKAKDLSDRSMTTSTTATPNTALDDAALKFLKDNGIL